MTSELRVFNTVDLGTVLDVDLDRCYQGSTAAVVRINGWSSHLAPDARIGLLIIGYGSCCGCDTWQALEDDPEGKLKYCLELLNDIRWFDNLADLQTFVAGTPGENDASDHALQWYGHSDYFPLFQARVAALTGGELVPIAWADDITDQAA